MLRTLVVWAVTLLAVCACANHDYERERVGGPVPIYDGGEPGDAAQPDGDANRQVTWCEVLTVLRAKCHRCHQNPPLNGAPFPLLTYDETQVRSGTLNTPRWQRMQKVVSDGFMPATWLNLDPPVQPLTPDEKATLLLWFEQGAQPVGLECP